MPPSSAFTPPPFAPTVPVPDYILRVAQAYPDREVVCYLQDVTSAHGVSATSITWRQFLADVWSRADYLVEVTGLDPRPIGSEPVVVGLLAESNYDFLVDLVAMFMLRWQVRVSMMYSPSQHELLGYPDLSCVHPRNRRLFSSQFETPTRQSSTSSMRQTARCSSWTPRSATCTQTSLAKAPIRLSLRLSSSARLFRPTGTEADSRARLPTSENRESSPLLSFVEKRTEA